MAKDEMSRDEFDLAQDALSAYWNDLASGRAPEADRRSLDPALAETVRQIRADGEMPPPPTGLADRIWADLMREAGDLVAPVGPAPLPLIGPNGHGPHVGPPRTAHRQSRPRRWWPPLEFAAALLLIAALGGAALSLGPGWPGRGGGDEIGAEVSDWATFRGNAARTGTIPGQGPAGDLGLRWTFVPEAPLHPTLVVAGATAYVGGDERHLYALDAATGAERWRFSPALGVEGTPTVLDGAVYVGSKDGTLYAVDAATGTQRWAVPTGGELCCSPVAGDGTVYAGSASGDFLALDAASGAERWRFRVDGASWSSPALAGGTVYAGTGKKELYALDAATGAERWRVRLAGTVVTTPAVADGTVYVATWNGGLYALDAATGEERWLFVADKSIFAPAVAGERVVAGGEDGNVYGLDAATGEERWRFATGDRVRAQPAIVGETVYVGSHDGFVYALDLASGVELGRYLVARVDYGPVVAAGTLYVWGLDRRLSVLGPGGDPLPTELPPSAQCDCGTKSDLWSR